MERGKLFNSANGWIVVYKSMYTGNKEMIPLEDRYNTDQDLFITLRELEGSDVEFELLEISDGLSSQTTKSAKLLLEKQVEEEVLESNKDWDLVFQKWVGSKIFSKTIDGLQEFLEKNYNSPSPK
jgi:hypothetical protein